MAFEYKSNIRAKLTPNEEQLLKSIDDFLFSLGQYKNLGELHQRLQENGGVILENKQNPVNGSIEITPAERKTILTKLDIEIKSKDLEISRLHARWEEVHMENNSIGVQQVNSEMQSICNDKRGLVETKKRFRCAKTQRNGNYKVDTCHYVYGEYRPIPDQVLLYYDWIQSEKELAVVYVHEMLHAYLRILGDNNRDFGFGGWKTIKEIEEPIVESATLKFFEAFGNQEIYVFAKEFVRKKQFIVGITYYGFGYYVYHNANALDYVKQYKKVKPRLLNSLPKVEFYLDYWRLGVYPFKQEQECLEALYKALRCVHLNGRRHYTINNGEESYSMYEVIEEFVIFLLNQGLSISKINQKIQNYVNNTWVFVSRTPKTVAYYTRGEYSSTSGFYITKQWKGNTGGNFSQLKDGINGDYPNFQIVEI